MGSLSLDHLLVALLLLLILFGQPRLPHAFSELALAWRAFRRAWREEFSAEPIDTAPFEPRPIDSRCERAKEDHRPC